MKILCGKNYFLISKKERWGLTWPGVALLLIACFILIFLFFNNLYSILAPVSREKATVLVVEGSVNDHVLMAAMQEFNTGKYKLLITTGTPLEYGAMLSAYKTTAAIAGQSLLKLGFDSAKLVIAGTEAIIHDRTFNSAIRLKQWLRENQPGVKALNLMSLGVHGGRSRLLFQAALGDSIKVGIISVPNQYYNGETWIRSSKGFRETMNEAIGYFYTRYFFRPYENELVEK